MFTTLLLFVFASKIVYASFHAMDSDGATANYRGTSLNFVCTNASRSLTYWEASVNLQRASVPLPLVSWIPGVRTVISYLAYGPPQFSMRYRIMTTEEMEKEANACKDKGFSLQSPDQSFIREFLANETRRRYSKLLEWECAGITCIADIIEKIYNTYFINNQINVVYNLAGYGEANGKMALNCATGFLPLMQNEPTVFPFGKPESLVNYARIGQTPKHRFWPGRLIRAILTTELAHNIVVCHKNITRCYTNHEEELGKGVYDQLVAISIRARQENWPTPDVYLLTNPFNE